MTLRAVFLLLLVLGAPVPAVGATDDAGLCDSAARKAERKFQIPNGLLQAVARVETNSASADDMTAWPWTVNIAGEGRWFKTRGAAESYLDKSQKRGVQSIDVGCFQINTKWHGDAFDSAAAMFDPQGSADYAATFLNALKQEKGDWKSAIEAYHSRTPGKSKPYADKVMTAYAQTRAPAFALFETKNEPASLSLIAWDAPGGIALSLFHKTAPLLNATGRGPIVNRAPIPSILGEQGDGAE